MQIKIMSKADDTSIKFESSGSIKEIQINEDFLHPDGENIAVCFRGKASSGIIDFTPKEIEDIYRSVKDRMHLIKGMKKI